MNFYLPLTKKILSLFLKNTALSIIGHITKKESGYNLIVTVIPQYLSQLKAEPHLKYFTSIIDKLKF